MNLGPDNFLKHTRALSVDTRSGDRIFDALILQLLAPPNSNKVEHAERRVKVHGNKGAICLRTFCWAPGSQKQGSRIDLDRMHG